MDEAREELADALLPVTAVAVTAVVALAAVLDTGLTAELAVVGYLLVVPLVTLLEGTVAAMLRPDGAPVDEDAAALDRLRERYAAGEIDEAEFERRVERLLETETVADAETRHGASGDGSAAREAEEA
jgi:hypothetical protein